MQLDELKTFLGSRKQQTWIFTAIEVSSRLWPATLVVSRSYSNTKTFIRSIADSCEWSGFPLIMSDGMKFSGRAIQLTFGVACVHAQVIKEIKQNRVVKVGAQAGHRFGVAVGRRARRVRGLDEVEHRVIERLNLTIHQGSAYLNRWSPCHARKKRTLEDHLELLRCRYNFCRAHRWLKFGTVTRTPATQAGLATGMLTFRDVFVLRLRRVRFVLVGSGRPAYQEGMMPRKCAAQQQPMKEAPELQQLT